MPDLAITIVVWILALGLSVGAGWAVTILVLKWAKVPDPPPQTVRDRGKEVPVLSRDEVRADVLRGGTWIGVLERLAITTCVLAGQPGLIAVVVGVKGLGRYPELKENPGAAERFLIGSAASMLSAVWVGMGALAVLTHFVG